MKNAHLVHRGRRDALIAAMRKHAGGGLALVPTSPEVARNRDSLYPYRFDSYFYYLTGFPEPDAVVALVAEDGGDRHVLFCREKNLEREIWDGYRFGPETAREMFAFDHRFVLEFEFTTTAPVLALFVPRFVTVFRELFTLVVVVPPQAKRTAPNAIKPNVDASILYFIYLSSLLSSLAAATV